jgi:hypothetical protein
MNIEEVVGKIDELIDELKRNLLKSRRIAMPEFYITSEVTT